MSLCLAGEDILDSCDNLTERKLADIPKENCAR
jgi:hypothetical protein